MLWEGVRKASSRFLSVGARGGGGSLIFHFLLEGIRMGFPFPTFFLEGVRVLILLHFPSEAHVDFSLHLFIFFSSSSFLRGKGGGACAFPLPTFSQEIFFFGGFLHPPLSSLSEFGHSSSRSQGGLDANESSSSNRGMTREHFGKVPEYTHLTLTYPPR